MFGYGPVCVFNEATLNYTIGYRNLAITELCISKCSRVKCDNLCVTAKAGARLNQAKGQSQAANLQ